MVSDEPTEGRCNAKAGPDKDGYCESYPIQGAERCRMHGGTSEGGTREGAGAPEGNGNAITHGAKADPFNLYRHLSDEHREWVISLIEGYCEHLGYEEGDPRIEHVKRGCMHLYQANSGENQILEDGLSESQTIGVSETGQPIVRDDGHHLDSVVLKRDKEARQIFRTLGAYDDPETQKANAIGDLSSIIMEEST